jgi:predicted phosphodiesterase
MRLLILSDLHIELWKDNAPNIDLEGTQPDVVILAGDIHTGTKGITWAEQVFPNLPVIYVSGNHESYGSNLDDVEAALMGANATSPNVRYLNQTETIIGNVRFLGATLWSDFRLFPEEQIDRYSAMMEAEASMNDYRRIRLAKKGYRKLRAADTAYFHAQQRLWLTKQLALPFSGKTVVVTHMAPSFLSVSPQYANDAVSACYASRLDGLVEQADLWVHGHMHETFDYQIGKGRVVCNPRGYKTRSGAAENPNFTPSFVVNLTN